jgi:flavorubredoxin
MFTHLIEDNRLFTCDFLGPHQPFNAEHDEIAAKKYYAEIMMPFAPMCRKYIQTVRDIAPTAVLTSHGVMYEDPEVILRLYEDWASADGKNLVLIPYISMYGSTKTMAQYLAEKLEKSGIKAQLHDIVNGDMCELAVGLVDATTIIAAAPMVLAAAHPMMLAPASLIGILKAKVKFMSVIGSYGWGGDLAGKLTAAIAGIKPEILEPVLAKGMPHPQDFANLDKLAKTIYEKHKSLGLV